MSECGRDGAVGAGGSIWHTNAKSGQRIVVPLGHGDHMFVNGLATELGSLAASMAIVDSKEGACHGRTVRGQAQLRRHDQRSVPHDVHARNTEAERRRHEPRLGRRPPWCCACPGRRRHRSADAIGWSWVRSRPERWERRAARSRATKRWSRPRAHRSRQRAARPMVPPSQ